MTLGLLICCFFIILYVSVAQDSYNRDKNAKSSIVWVLSVVSSLIIIVINSLLTIFIYKFADFEIYNSLTDFHISIAYKLSISQFINTAIISFFTNLLLNGRNFNIDGGLINDIFSIIMSNAIVPTVMEFLNIPNITKYI